MVDVDNSAWPYSHGALACMVDSHNREDSLSATATSLLVQIIFSTLLLTSIIAASLGILRSPAWYWIAGIAAHFWSGMTLIGMLTVSLSFVLLALAIGHTTGWIHSIKRSLVAVAAGLLIWPRVFLTVDDYWVFWPVFKAIPEAP